MTDTPFALPCTFPVTPVTPPAPDAAADAAVAAICDSAAAGGASEDLDLRELRRSLEDGEVVWQPHASETPQLESISEADAEEEAGTPVCSSLPMALATRSRGAGGAPAAAGDPEAPDAADATEAPGEEDGLAAEGGAAGDGGAGAAAVEGPGPPEGEEEARVAGAVQWPVYDSYLRAVGWPMVAAVLISLALMQVRCLCVLVAIQSAGCKRFQFGLLVSSAGRRLSLDCKM